VGAPWGVKGWIHVDSYTDPPDGILEYRQWTLRLGSGERITRRLIEGRPHSDRLVARLEGIEDRDRLAPSCRRRVSASITKRICWV
jgi:16S rRNA processing protein RimM